jgi:prepilin peptidase CpaA
LFVWGVATLVLALRLPFGQTAIASSLATGLIVFALLFIAYTRNAIGGGDVKLLTALSLGLPPIETVHFIVMTALAGGVVGLIYLGLARLRPALRHGRDRFILRRLFIIECWRARRYRTVPYAVAIAAGAASVLLPAMLPARFAL